MKGLALFPDMTSCDYQRLNRGKSDQGQIKAYGDLITEHSRKKIMALLAQSMDGCKTAADMLEISDQADEIHYEYVWSKRRKLVEAMNRATLNSLAEHYEIIPGAGGIRNHPAADHLDKGPILKRLKQFLWWDGEYHGTAPGMLKIDVEASLDAAEKRMKRPQPPNAASLESVLRHASTCKTASDSMLLSALKDCIAVTCACPVLKKNQTYKIKITTERIDEFGDPEDYEESDAATESLESLREALVVQERTLLEILAYVDGFSPSNPTPQNVEVASDKWFDSQFPLGSPVGSIVRMAWLLDVFHSFWKQHQNAYLVNDPSLRERFDIASASGKRGAEIKIDAKWRERTSLFVEYVSSSARSVHKLSRDQLHDLLDTFGEHLMAQKKKGASDKRTIAIIKEFMSTLVILMDRNADADEIQITWSRLRSGAADQRKEKAVGEAFYDDDTIHAKSGSRKGGQKFNPSTDDTTTRADKKLRGTAGKFRSGPFSSLPFETFTACLEILRGAPRPKKVPSGGGAPSKGNDKKSKNDFFCL